MNSDTVKGKIKEVGGQIRKEIGKATGDNEAAARGALDQASGTVQKNYGKLKDAANS